MSWKVILKELPLVDPAEIGEREGPYLAYAIATSVIQQRGGIDGFAEGETEKDIDMRKLDRVLNKIWRDSNYINEKSPIQPEPYYTVEGFEMSQREFRGKTRYKFNVNIDKITRILDEGGVSNYDEFVSFLKKLGNTDFNIEFVAKLGKNYSLARLGKKQDVKGYAEIKANIDSSNQFPITFEGEQLSLFVETASKSRATFSQKDLDPDGIFDDYPFQRDYPYNRPTAEQMGEGLPSRSQIREDKEFGWKKVLRRSRNKDGPTDEQIEEFIRMFTKDDSEGEEEITPQDVARMQQREYFGMYFDSDEISYKDFLAIVRKAGMSISEIERNESMTFDMEGGFLVDLGITTKFGNWSAEISTKQGQTIDRLETPLSGENTNLIVANFMFEPIDFNKFLKLNKSMADKVLSYYRKLYYGDKKPDVVRLGTGTAKVTIS